MGRAIYLVLGWLFVVLAVLVRFVPHSPNFSPVFGALLFGGARLKSRDAVWFPLALLATAVRGEGLWHALDRPGPATSAATKVEDGIDTFIFRDGQIRLQTVRYTLQHTLRPGG